MNSVMKSTTWLCKTGLAVLWIMLSWSVLCLRLQSLLLGLIILLQLEIVFIAIGQYILSRDLHALVQALSQHTPCSPKHGVLILVQPVINRILKNVWNEALQNQPWVDSALDTSSEHLGHYRRYSPDIHNHHVRALSEHCDDFWNKIQRHFKFKTITNQFSSSDYYF